MAVDGAAIAALFGTFNTMKNIAQAMITLHDTQALQAKTIEFNSAIIDAQDKLFAIQNDRTTAIEKIRALEEKVVQLENWNAEKDKYELKDLYQNGAFARVLKPQERGSSPPHLICANCFEEGKKPVLQRAAQPDRGMWPWRCPTCKTAVYASWDAAQKAYQNGP